ncbi:MAG: hypothetical protein EZS28_045229 [Streblomastix strix]|uniref:Uncharacterized protein n=1 Tax=Streblomastix strix TaxID=222440 RepID=A0A5J4TLH2_9EUKA|nr:MAG: hypothetical protein EZS28_045229 [Streblomastix strix]
MNKSIYQGHISEYFDEIDDEVIVVEEYYRKLYLNKRKGGSLYVNARDIDNKSRKIALNRFKKIRDLD